jgi:hypothetical protein
MLAARNRRFRIAAIIGALSYLIFAACEVVEANRLFGLSGLPGGYRVSAVIISVAHIVGAGGWVVVATGLGAKLDWPRLRRGGALVAASLIAYFLGVALRAQTVVDVDYPDTTNVDLFFIFDALSALLFAVAAVVVLAACVDSRRGPTRARWLRAAAVIAVLAYLVATVSLLFEHAYWSGLGATYPGYMVQSEITTGVIVAAVGSFGLAVGAGVFARRVTEPLRRRESALAAAAAILAVATICVAGGEALIAYGYRDDQGSVEAAHWLAVGGRLVSAIAVVWLALGARTARATSARST